MAVITISRQYGSGGDEIARQLCELLAYGYFDKLLLVYTAAKMGLAESEIVDLSENNYRVRSLFDQLIVGWRSPRTIAQAEIWQQELFGGQSPAASALNKAKSQALVESALQMAYRHDNCRPGGTGCPQRPARRSPRSDRSACSNSGEAVANPATDQRRVGPDPAE